MTRRRLENRRRKHHGAGTTTGTCECPTCHEMVPDAEFCGDCGADLHAAASEWQRLLRPGFFAASSHERVFIPRLTSTIFPRLPIPARPPYRAGLIALFITIAVMSSLRWNAPLAAISILGGPLLFLLYVVESDGWQDIRRSLVISVVLGTVIGLAWWWTTGNLLSDKYGVSTAAAQALENTLVDEGLAITLIGAVLMVLPLPLIKRFSSPDQDALDGFAIGAAGALAHVAASYVVWWVPQIVVGLINSQTTSAARMLMDAITFGVIDPLTTLTLGGMVGIALWFRPDPGCHHPRRALWAVILCAVTAGLLYAVIWIVDAEEWDHGVELAINLALTVLSLLTLRAGMQIALLHERHDELTGEPILCVQCEKVVPDMVFCPDCGASSVAASQSSERLRRQSRPVPVDSTG